MVECYLGGVVFGLEVMIQAVAPRRALISKIIICRQNLVLSIQVVMGRFK